jgi:hypothetical protein
MSSSPLLSPGARRALDDLAADFARIFGVRFEALVAYTEPHAVAFVTTLTAGDLDACGALADTWHRHGLRTPLVMTADEFRHSLDAFPLEYQAILDAHVVIAGTPPFTGVAINQQDVRRACEAQARGFLIHLRQGWIDAAGHHDRLAACLAASASPLRNLLTNSARLQARPGSPGDLPAFARDVVRMPADLVTAVLALEHAPDRALSLVPRMGEYLAACERLWEFVDAWRD